MITLSTQQNQIVSIVSKFGCADINQIYSYMNDLKPKAVQLLVNSLIKANVLELRNERFLVIKGKSDMFNMDTINCIWTMLKLTSEKDDITTAIPGTEPAKILVVANNKHSFEIIPVNEAKTAVLRRMQEKMLDKHVSTKKLSFNWMVFVVQTKDTIKLIKSCNFNFPYMVAYISEKDENGIPTIQLIRNVPEGQ